MLPVLDIVTFMWNPSKGYRSKFTPEHVFTMRRMIERHYRGAFRLHCVTDSAIARGVPRKVAGIVIHKLWPDFADLPSPHGSINPSCYRRLKLWAPEARERFGPRILQIDLDMVLVGDVTPLWNRPEPIVFWEDQLNRHNKINGAMQLFDAGARPDVWTDFDPATSPAIAKAAGNWGSDQAWLSYKIKDDWARWTTKDGAYSWRVHCEPNGEKLPADARIVNFHGHKDPWSLVDTVPWIGQHYR